MNRTQLPPWSRPANYSRDRHQEVVDAVNSVLSDVPSADGSEVRSGPYGKSTTRDDQPQRPRQRFKITGTKTKVGMYTANPLNPAKAIDPSVLALAETDFGVVDTTTTVYLINDLEEGNPSGHTLANARICAGDFSGYAIDGKRVYAITEC